MIRITAKKANFRRAGISHPATPTDYPDDFFDGERLRALYEEPMLVVETLPDPAPADPAPADPAPEQSLATKKN